MSQVMKGSERREEKNTGILLALLASRLTSVALFEPKLPWFHDCAALDDSWSTIGHHRRNGREEAPAWRAFLTRALGTEYGSPASRRDALAARHGELASK